jgi:hypothetical protein
VSACRWLCGRAPANEKQLSAGRKIPYEGKPGRAAFRDQVMGSQVSDAERYGGEVYA